jgi:hypothetical protein
MICRHARLLLAAAALCFIAKLGLRETGTEAEVSPRFHAATAI